MATLPYGPRTTKMPGRRSRFGTKAIYRGAAAPRGAPLPTIPAGSAASVFFGPGVTRHCRRPRILQQRRVLLDSKGLSNRLVRGADTFRGAAEVAREQVEILGPVPQMSKLLP
uniref:Uncharacterized protein n=1 Tax=Corethron hystrix TaxID=216773 RepID=A0A7S1B4R4_9STRA